MGMVLSCRSVSYSTYVGQYFVLGTLSKQIEPLEHATLLRYY